MVKKILFILLLAAGFVLAIHLLGEQSTPQANGQTDSQPPAGRMRMAGWLEDLETAYQQNDRDKMGQLIAQMKQTRQNMPGRGQAGMGGPGRGGPGFGGPGMGPAQTAPGGQAFFPNTLRAKDDAEQKILSVLDTLDRTEGRGMMNVPEIDGRLLRLLTETTGAKTVVEIGTSNGYSGIWFCLALRKTDGRLITHEIDAGRASLARENFQKAGVANLVTLVEGDAHETVTQLKDPIDILFLDADKEGYIDYLNKLVPLVRPGGLIIAHNITPRQADPEYIKAITTNPQLESLLLHQDSGGVSVTVKKR
ncbi:MAG: O-methyltransferase [Sedimentisphaerales bacterium]|nr:O-methyltransferase [Sedimentisphaerales bacterium]